MHTKQNVLTALRRILIWKQTSVSSGRTSLSVFVFVLLDVALTHSCSPPQHLLTPHVPPANGAEVLTTKSTFVFAV